MSDNYESMPLPSLRELAKSHGIKGVSALRKQELIDALKMAELSKEQPKIDEAAKPGKKASISLEGQKQQDNSTGQDGILNHGKSEGGSQIKGAPIKEVNSNKEESINKKISSSKEENQNKVESFNKEVSSGKEEIIIKEVSSSKEDGSNKIESLKKEDSLKKEVRQVQSNNSTIRERASNRTDASNQSQQRNQQPMMRKSVMSSSSSNGSYQQRADNARADENETGKASGQKSDNNKTEPVRTDLAAVPSEYEQLDSGETKRGILEVLSDGYGFIRCDNFLPGENDVYVSPAQIRRFNLKTGDIIVGNTRVRNQNEKFSALLYVKSINGLHPTEATKRKRFEDLTPIYPNDRIHLETPGCGPAMRMVDIICPIGKGQRGMIVSQPKAGKTTLLKQVAKAITKNHSDMHLIVLLIDERPEEVTDMKESIEGGNVEVIYSTFDELPENHKRVSEMVIERAKRLVEHKRDVVILLDSITRLARAYNLTCQSSGRTLSGGLDPAALHMPKKFFGAARNMREGGSLTILATALVETGSRMDDVVFEEFKGTGNMELVLDRSLSEKRIFPAIDLPKSSTRRDDLLLTQSELEANYLMRKALNGVKSEEAVERIVQLFVGTKSNHEFVEMIKKTKL